MRSQVYRAALRNAEGFGLGVISAQASAHFYTSKSLRYYTISAVYQRIKLCPHTSNTHGQPNVRSAESACPAIFTSWAPALCLHPSIAQMFQLFDVRQLYHLANANISDIKTIIERDLQSALQTHGREIAGGLLL